MARMALGRSPMLQATGLIQDLRPPTSAVCYTPVSTWYLHCLQSTKPRRELIADGALHAGDVTTRPTPAMLESLISLKDGGLGDDVFREDETTNSLEAFIAELTGFPAALLVMSGTMGNQLSIRTHLQGPPHSVVADSRSHIIGWSVHLPSPRAFVQSSAGSKAHKSKMDQARS